MLAVREAIHLVLEHTRRLDPERVTLEAAWGRFLAEDVVSDVDVPPFDRAAMDGFAVLAADTSDPPTTLRLVGDVAAGQVASFRVRRGQAAGISTGAPLPPGTDAVQQVEKVRVEGDRVVVFEPVERGRNVVARGRELTRGAVALEKGARLEAAAIGVLATVGRTEVLVHRQPAVNIIATGSELVDASAKPAEGKIRNSNGPALRAAVAAAGGVGRILGIAPDDEERLDRVVEEGLGADVLILTGGVSVGEHDLVEASLRRFDVEILFDSVAVKPGKPVTFGTHPGGLVFGLPGNPVSALVTFHLLVAPALRGMRGSPNPSGPRVTASLRGGFRREASRTGYAPAWTEWDGEGFRVRRLEIRGSADVVSAARANSLLHCPAGEEEFRDGQRMETLLLPGWDGC